MSDSIERPRTTSELLTEQFYRWEVRGRGWTVWDRPVELEPPFRPFEGHYLPSNFFQDDGVRETGLSLFAKRLLGQSGKEPEAKPAEPSSDIEEPEPEYLEGSEELIELQVSLPADYKAEHEVFEQCLLNLNYCRGSLAFEVVGTQEELIAQVVAGASDAELVSSQIKGHFPEAVVNCAQSYLDECWAERDGFPREILEFGLDQEFMLPLNSVRLMATDPLIGVCAALEHLRDGEMGVFQVIFTPTQHRWAESILRAVTANDGEPFFENAREMVSQAKLKLACPLYAVVVRVAAWSPKEDRVGEVIRGLGGVLKLFANPSANELVALENENYPDDAHEEDLLNRCSRRSGMLLNSDELVSLAHLPMAAVRSRKLKRQVERTKQAPAIVTGKGIVLGENQHDGTKQMVALTAEQRTRHMHVIGASGTGKSTFLLNLIVQDIENGDGVAVLDPHGDLVDAVLSRIPSEKLDNVVLFDPSDEEFPVGFNILSAYSDLERNLLEGDLVAVFQRLSTSWGDQMTAVLGNGAMAFLESSQGGTLADLRRFLLEGEFRQEFLKTVEDPEIVYYWKRQFPLLTGKPQSSVVTRLDSFLRPKAIRYMVCQKNSKLDFGEIMNNGKIFLAKLPQGLIGEENSYLLGTLLVAKFHQMAIGRQSLEAGKRRDFWLYVDEFHNFITPSMASILTGARKYRLGLVLAHQELGQLKNRNPEVASAVLAGPYTRVCFRLGDEDARKLADGFSSFEAQDFQNLGIGEAICRVERREFDFNLCVTPLPEIPKHRAEVTKTEVRRRSREAYATPKAKVVEQMAQLWEMPPDAPASSRKSRHGPSAGEEPAPPVTEGEKTAREDRVSGVEQRIPPPLPEIESKPPPTPGRGGPEHKRIQHLLRMVAEGLGWRVETEAKVPDGWVDLALAKASWRIGIQISITNHADYEIASLKKCLASDFTFLLMVCDDAKKLQRLQDAANKSLAESERRKLKWFLKDEVPGFLREVGGGAAAGTVAGRTVKVKHASADLEGEAKAHEEINKAVAEALRKRKKAGKGKS